MCAGNLNFGILTDLPSSPTPPPTLLWPLFCPSCPIEPLPCPILALFSVGVRATRWRDLLWTGQHKFGWSWVFPTTQHPETSPTRETSHQLAATYLHTNTNTPVQIQKHKYKIRLGRRHSNLQQVTCIQSLIGCRHKNPLCTVYIVHCTVSKEKY